MSPVASRLGRFASIAIPFLTALICVLIGAVPFSVSNGFLVTPLFPLMAIFYWSIVRPDLMGPTPVFIIGLLQDIYTAGPPGFWALIFLAAYAFSVSQRILFTGRFALGPWLGFAMTALMAVFLAWVIASIFHGGPVAPLPFFVQFVASVTFYPLFMRIFALAGRGLARGV